MKFLFVYLFIAFALVGFSFQTSGAGLTGIGDFSNMAAGSRSNRLAAVLKEIEEYEFPKMAEGLRRPAAGLRQYSKYGTRM